MTATTGGRLTTHVLDTATGRPAEGLAITLYRISGNSHRKMKTVTTNADGRCDQPLLEERPSRPAGTNLVFAAGDYLRRSGVALPDRLPRRGPDPLRHGRGQALSRASSDLALRLLDLSRKLSMSPKPSAANPLHPERRGCPHPGPSRRGHPPRLPAPAPRTEGHERRMRRRRLRGLHRSRRSSGRQRAGLRKRQRLYPLRGVAGPHACGHRRASEPTRGAAASGAAGAGGRARFAMRLLHAGLRHVDLRAVDAQAEPDDECRGGARAAGQSLPVHRLRANRACRHGGRPLGSPKTDPLVAERKSVVARLKALDDGARVEVGTGGKRSSFPPMRMIWPRR